MTPQLTVEYLALEAELVRGRHSALALGHHEMVRAFVQCLGALQMSRAIADDEDAELLFEELLASVFALERLQTSLIGRRTASSA